MWEGKVFWMLVCLAWCLGQLHLEGTPENSPDDQRSVPLVTAIQFHHAGECPLILLPVYVNGKGPYEFILDTGAAQSVLTPGLAQELGVESTGTREGMGAGGRVTVHLGTVDSLAVGDAHQAAIPVGITDELNRIGTAIGARIDGAIGYDFLKHFRVTIDYTQRRLRLEQAAASTPVGVPVKFQLAPRKPLVIVPVLVSGRGPFQFVVDTGASSSAISPELAADLRIPTRSTAAAGLGAGGAVKISVVKLDALQVGDALPQSLTAIAPEMLTTLSQAVGARLDGIVGYDYLRNFRVTIDYPHNRLVLEPSTSR